MLMHEFKETIVTKMKPALCLATQAGKMARSCLLRSWHSLVLQENSILFSHNISLINQACLVKIA